MSFVSNSCFVEEMSLNTVVIKNKIIIKVTKILRYDVFMLCLFLFFCTFDA